MITFKKGDWVEANFWMPYPIIAQVIRVETVELERTIRHPLRKTARKLLLEGEAGTVFSRLEHDVRRIPTVEEKFGGDYA